MLHYRPATVSEALDCVDDADPAGSRFYAGGVETGFALRTNAIDCRRLIDTKRIEGAASISRTERRVVIGPATTHHTIGLDATIEETLPLLGEACRRLGTLPIRTQGTIGGNFAYGHQHTDPGTAAMLYGGSVNLVSRSGHR